MTIQVNATALSNPGFHLDGQWYSGTATVTVMPGRHDFLTPTSSLDPNRAIFTVTSAGTVDYAPEDDGVLGGRGTSTLIVRGRTIRLDATALSNPAFYFGQKWYSGTAIQTVTVMPGRHDFLTPTSSLDHNRAIFTVTSAGTVDYAPEDDGVFGGRGTSTLIVRGCAIRLDATALSNSSFYFSGKWYSNDTVLKVTVMPGRHDILTPSLSTGPNITVFLVRRDRKIDYESALNGLLAGRGTSTLLMRGAIIFVDARCFSNGQLVVNDTGWLPTDSMIPYAFMPGHHELLISANGVTKFLTFELSTDGMVNYSPDKEGTVLTGSGTNTLVLLSTALAVQNQRSQELVYPDLR